MDRHLHRCSLQRLLLLYIGSADLRERRSFGRSFGRTAARSVCFCGHGAEVWFRNLRIKEL